MYSLTNATPESKKFPASRTTNPGSITFIIALAGTVITAQGSMPLPSALVDASHKPAMPKTGFA